MTKLSKGQCVPFNGQSKQTIDTFELL